MLRALSILENDLLSNTFNDVSSLVNHVVNNSSELTLDEVAMLTELAAFELSHNVPLKQFV
jgi:hypothetical protein